MNEQTPLRYKKGVLDEDGLQRLIEKYWNELEKDTEEQKKLGLDLSKLNGAIPFEVRTDGQGIGGSEIVILILIHVGGSIAYDTLKTVWKSYMLRKIKSRGVDNIGEQE